MLPRDTTFDHTDNMKWKLNVVNVWMHFSRVEGDEIFKCYNSQVLNIRRIVSIIGAQIFE